MDVTVVVRMRVRSLGRANPVLEARQRRPVRADVAIHPDVPRQRLVIALSDQAGQFIGVAEYVRAAHVDARMRGAVRTGLVSYPVRQDAGEQEVPGHDDLPGPEQPAALQPGGHIGAGQRHECGLSERVVPALPEQPGCLAHLGVRVRVGGAAPGQQQRCAAHGAASASPGRRAASGAAGWPAAARSSAFSAAAATAEPPFSEMLVSARSPLARSASFASAAPTNPTGRPTTNAGSTSLLRISRNAVGAQPTTQTAPGPTAPNASRTAAAALVMF